MTSQKFASLERRLLDYVTKKYPAPIKDHFKDTRHPSKLMVKMQKEEKKLFQILSMLPNYGIGRLFVSAYEAPDAEAPIFWRVTGVQVDHADQDLEHGVAFGIFTNRGYCTGYQQEIPQVNVEQWRLVPKIEESKYLNCKPAEIPQVELPMYVNYPPLLERMMKAKEIKQGTKPCEVHHPMMRLLVKRHPFQPAQQRLEDGTLV